MDASLQLELARCLFREANDALFVFDPADLRVEDLNPAAMRLTGLDRREAVGLTLTDLLSADLPSDLDRLVDANRKTVFFHSQEGYNLLRRDGPPVPVNISVSRVHVRPRPLGLAVVRDVSERRRAQEVLDRFFRLSPALFAVLDPAGRFLRLNPAWLDLLGRDPGDLVGTEAIDLVHPDDREASLIALADLRRGLPTTSESRHRHRDGSYRLFAWNAAPSEGQVFAVAIDVTERDRARELERANREAEAAGRAKDRFLAVLSHELRTPLNPILLAVTTMLEGITPPEEYAPALEMIRRNVELESRLIDDLLDVTRIVQGKLQLRPALLDAHDLIRQAAETCRGDASSKGVRLDLDLAAPRRAILADPTRLPQVVWNLLKNAIKFTPPGGLVVARTRTEADLFILEVTDTGLGIAPAELSRIFEPFQQADPSIAPRFGGLGLGLAIARGILDAHSGTLSAASPGPSLGSTFRVTLPLATSPT